MAIFSTMRSRRLANKETQNIIQVIGFRLHQEWFALPILSIHKIVPLGKVYGDPQNTGISITSYDGREILVIDVAKKIFNGAIEPIKESTAKPNLQIANSEDLTVQRYLAILSVENDSLVGLPIDSKPTMYRLEQAAFKTLPDAYLQQGNIRCVSSEFIELEELPPLFVLDPQKLVASMKHK